MAKLLTMSFVDSWVSNVEETSTDDFQLVHLMVSIFIHPRNISSEYATNDVSNLVKSREVNLEQPWNILLILVAFEVTNLLTSREVSEEQLRNIELI